MTWRTSFPDYPPTDMPSIPHGFDDLSWQNDACPSFADRRRGLLLFIDYADPAQREFEGDIKRFTVVSCDKEGSRTDDGFPPFDSDDWLAVLRFIDRHADQISLTGELTAWCETQGLEPASADEMLLRADLTPWQRLWLSDFVRRWEKAQDRPGFWATEEERA
jgi:hypothetical protein